MEGIQYKACTTAKPFDNGTDVGRGLLQFVSRQHVSATLVRIVAERELNFTPCLPPSLSNALSLSNCLLSLI